jgi:hypothetical protein
LLYSCVFEKLTSSWWMNLSQRTSLIRMLLKCSSKRAWGTKKRAWIKITSLFRIFTWTHQLIWILHASSCAYASIYAYASCATKRREKFRIN